METRLGTAYTVITNHPHFGPTLKFGNNELVFKRIYGYNKQKLLADHIEMILNICFIWMENFASH